MAWQRDVSIGGRTVAGGERAELRSPFDGSVVGNIGRASAAQMEEAIASAARAFAETKKLSGEGRANILSAIARGIAARADELAMRMVLEAGKPITDARGEVGRAVFVFNLAAKEAARSSEEQLSLVLPKGPARAGRVVRFPSGPVAAFSPFNFPLNLGAHKVAPAIAAGCPVVLKPPPQAPGCSLLLAEIIAATDWPRGAFSVVPCDNDVATKLVEDDRCTVFSFTGSAKVGWALKARAGKKRVLLELGSNSAVIIDRDTDVAAALPRIVYGSFAYAGQICISVQRIFVHRELFAPFREQFVARAGEVVCGDPRDPKTVVGPVIDGKAADRIESWFDSAIAAGAKVERRGKREGNVIPPCILANAPRETQMMSEELFGPGVVIAPFENFGDAIAATNDSQFGLQAGVYTKDPKNAERAFRELEVGGVIMNDIPTFRADGMPYGGVKNSGLGREGIRYAMEEMTEPRVQVV